MQIYIYHILTLICQFSPVCKYAECQFSLCNTLYSICFTAGACDHWPLFSATYNTSLFQNIYRAQAPGKIAFGSTFPGQILALQISPGCEFIVQKAGFLASEMGVELSVHFNQKVGGGFFGGEGFIMQRLSGNGIAFVECDGSLVEYDLAPGQELIVDTGNVLGFSSTVQLQVERVKGAKNILLGGEGLFNTRLTGPGHVWLQTMPLANFVNAITPYLPAGGSQ